METAPRPIVTVGATATGIEEVDGIVHAEGVQVARLPQSHPDHG